MIVDSNELVNAAAVSATIDSPSTAINKLVAIAVLRVVLIAVAAAAAAGRGGDRRSLDATEFDDRLRRVVVDDRGAAAEAEAASEPRRVIERRQPALVLDVELRAVLVQEPDDVGEAPQRGAVQRRCGPGCRRR